MLPSGALVGVIVASEGRPAFCPGVAAQGGACEGQHRLARAGAETPSHRRAPSDGESSLDPAVGAQRREVHGEGREFVLNAPGPGVGEDRRRWHRSPSKSGPGAFGKHCRPIAPTSSPTLGPELESTRRALHMPSTCSSCRGPPLGMIWIDLPGRSEVRCTPRLSFPSVVQVGRLL